MTKIDYAGLWRQNRSPDNMQSIRKVFDMWNSTLQNDFIPYVNLNVDEQLPTFQSIHSIKAWNVRNQSLGDLQQSNKLRIELGHLQKTMNPANIELLIWELLSV